MEYPPLRLMRAGGDAFTAGVLEQEIEAVTGADNHWNENVR
jgi:hypothetical protein